MAYTLPDLPYDYSALEPHIDTRTMEIHHGKHHQAYVDKTNAALEGTDWAEKPIEEVIANLNQLPEDLRNAVRGCGGGHANHSLFWTVMGPDARLSDGQGGGEPSGALAEAISGTFGSFESFKENFSAAAASLLGSGWVWLVVDGGKLAIESTHNQDSPLTEGRIPILTIDIWEHAYYLQYQNRRLDYIAAFWNVVNWAEVERRFDEVQ